MKAMPKKKREKEILVQPPYLRRVEEPLIKDTIDVERVSHWEISVKVSRYLRGLMIATGMLTFIFSTQFLLGPASLLDIKFLLTSQFKPLVIFMTGFIGAINILYGLVLLARD